MNYFGIIITLIILIWFRTWILNQTFSHLQGIRKRKLFLWGAILVFLLFFYEWIFNILGIDKGLYYIRESFNIPSVLAFLLYGILVLFGITIVFKNTKNKNILLEIGVVIFSLILLVFGSNTGGLAALVSYYLLAAFTEESFKFTVSNNQVEKVEKKEISTLLLLAILMGLSFSISENLLSFITILFQGGEITTSMLFGRGLIAALIHCVSTGMIALVLMKIKKGGLLFRYFLALFLGFSIHVCYNLALVYGLSWLVILEAIAAFIALSYLTFHIDELYMK